ncbi:MAG: ABC transporter permease [Promethearchaeota archaeon]
MNLKGFGREIYHIFAFVERDIRFELRFKYNLIINYISPILGIIFPIIILNRFFSYNVQFGKWTADNFLVYQFIAFEIGLIRGLLGFYTNILRREKMYTTLKLISISPCRNISLILSIYFTHFVFISIPFIAILIICYIYYPIKLITIIIFLLQVFCLSLFFSGIGIILSIISLIYFKYIKLINYLISLFFMFSCITYPFEIFPKVIQVFINLNPFYYIFDLLRMIWIDDDVLFSIKNHFFSFITFSIISVLIFSIGFYIFNKYYRKYGVAERA